MTASPLHRFTGTVSPASRNGERHHLGMAGEIISKAVGGTIPE
jgi:hypothetical protein